ncbi:MAG: hypothetical protein K6L60_01025 [Oceanobacter sp.]
MDMHPIALLLVSTLVLTACASRPASTCVDRAQGLSSQKPCWLINKPKEGITLKGSRTSWDNDGWFKAQQKLFKQAIATFGQQRISSEVTTSAVVETRTHVNSNEGASGARETVTRQVRVQDTTEISQTDTAVTVRASLKDYYYYPPTESVYIWAVEED